MIQLIPFVKQGHMVTILVFAINSLVSDSLNIVPVAGTGRKTLLFRGRFVTVVEVYLALLLLAFLPSHHDMQQKAGVTV